MLRFRGRLNSHPASFLLEYASSVFRFIASTAKSVRQQINRLSPNARAMGGTLITVATSLLAGIYWMVKDKGTPAWDQSHYLTLSLGYVEALREEGLSGLPEQILAEHARGPLLQILTTPFFLAFQPSVDSALALNLVLLLVLLFSVHAIAIRLFGPQAGVFATLFTAVTPIIMGLMHEVFVEFPLTAMSALAALLILRSQQFSNLSQGLLFGLVLGLGLLTKFTFPQFVIGPMIVGFFMRVETSTPKEPAQQSTETSLSPFPKRAGIALASLLLGAAIALPWYALPGKTSGVLAKVAGQLAPQESGFVYEVKKVSLFALTIVNDHLSWPIFIAFAIGCFYACRSLWRNRRRRFEPPIVDDDHPRFGSASLIFLVSWIVIPTGLMAFGTNQDIRLIAPAFPGIAILTAGAICSMKAARPRRLLLWGSATLSVIHAAVVSLGMAGSAVPQRVVKGPLWRYPPSSVPISDVLPALSVATPVGPAILALGQSRGYLHAPSPGDEAYPVGRFLAARTSASKHAVLVGMLHQDQVINPNSLKFITELEGANLEFDYALIWMSETQQLAAELGKYEYLLHLCHEQGKLSSSGHGKLELPKGECSKTIERLTFFGRPVARFASSGRREVTVIQRQT